MNTSQLRKQKGTLLKLRPLPIRLDGYGRRLRGIDDDWRLDEIMEHPAGVRLVNIATGHFVELGGDNIREFRTPRYLLLRCVLVIQGRECRIEPFVVATPRRRR